MRQPSFTAVAVRSRPTSRRLVVRSHRFRHARDAVRTKNKALEPAAACAWQDSPFNSTFPSCTRSRPSACQNITGIRGCRCTCHSCGPAPPPIRALESLDIAVRPGEIFGFLGPNGAGKSTMIRLLLGYLHPTAGEGRVLGLDIVRDSVAIRRRIGYLPGGIALYDSLTGERLLDYLAELTGRPPVRRARAVRAAGTVGPDASAARSRLFAGHAAKDRHCPGAPARPRARDSRRADRGARSR